MSRATHCKQGHEYTSGNTYVSPKGSRSCRKCNSEAARRYKRTNKGKLNSIKVARAADKRYPDKLKARKNLLWHVGAGNIVKPEVCSNCGRSGRIEAHHEDYSKQLDVLWLCQLCHKDRHGTLKSPELRALVRKEVL